MNKLTGTCLVLAFAVIAVPAILQQEKKPHEVTTSDVLDQIRAVIRADETEKRAANDTVAAVKQVALLNDMQINNFQVKQAMGARLDGPGYVLEQQGDAFKVLRASICKERPNLRVVSLDGNVEPCS
jgi:hypothetical protein